MGSSEEEGDAFPTATSAKRARKTESAGRDPPAIAETQKKAQEFCPGKEKVREFGVTSHMPALESEVEHACGEEDPASDKQTSKYE